MPRPHPPIFDTLGPELAELPRRKKRQRLSEREKLYILWARSQGLSYRRIAAGLNATTNTVHQHYQALISDPVLLFELPVLCQAGAKGYECQFCRAYRQGRIKAMRHVLAHFVDPEIAPVPTSGTFPRRCNVRTQEAAPTARALSTNPSPWEEEEAPPDEQG